MPVLSNDEQMTVLDDSGLGHLWSRIKQLVENLVGGVERYPVGSIYLSVNNENPSKYFGGTWVAWGIGRVPVSVDVSQTEFNSVEKTGGEKTHKLTINETPTHAHVQRKQMGNGMVGSKVITTQSGTAQGDGPEAQVDWYTGKALLHTGDAGGGQAHNNLPPYITCYMWKRTA